MKRTFRSFPVNDVIRVKEQMLSWGSQFSICCYLDDNQYRLHEHRFECVLAVNAVKSLHPANATAFEQLQEFVDENKDWCFGHLSYDLKNEIEDLQSENADSIGFDALFFFVPEIILILCSGELLVGLHHHAHEEIIRDVLGRPPVVSPRSVFPAGVIKSRFSKEEYIETIQQLQQHISRGDCYEINFCQEFYVDYAEIDPLEVYRALNRVSPNPFSCYYRLDDKYLLCASPERYLQKNGNRVISQPIKGTSRRDNSNHDADILYRTSLQQSLKERSENIMIVDLVRNDLSKVCREGTVKVDELMGVYSFPQVYQMISTISGEVEESKRVTDILKASFPMGSMTGAPKRKVMQLIEKHEKTKRGLFSGSVGYITPDRNMDFNVVIRSILYNSSNRYLSFQTGSAITANSCAEDEYEECLLKADAIKKVLNG
ncbi:MAG: anthranilate synthase component I family protein [Chitinophagaceae bacterium]|nr:anthranilate synthase component I family protein [Chitinophagaceae bacterium]